MEISNSINLRIKMAVYWMPCFLCLTDPEHFKGTGQINISERFNKVAKFKSNTCPLCDGKGRLAIKPYREKPWEKGRRDYL